MRRRPDPVCGNTSRRRSGSRAAQSVVLDQDFPPAPWRLHNCRGQLLRGPRLTAINVREGGLAYRAKASKGVTQRQAMYQRILVPIDGSSTSGQGLTEAISLARLTGGRIRLLHVVDAMPVAVSADALAGYSADILPIMREAGEAILAQARKRVEAAGLAAETSLREVVAGRVSDLVVDEAVAWSANLIVLGTHGRRGVRRLLLGSDAEQILRTAPVPVLLVRGE